GGGGPAPLAEPEGAGVAEAPVVGAGVLLPPLVPLLPELGAGTGGAPLGGGGLGGGGLPGAAPLPVLGGGGGGVCEGSGCAGAGVATASGWGRTKPWNGRRRLRSSLSATLTSAAASRVVCAGSTSMG